MKTDAFADDNFDEMGLVKDASYWEVHGNFKKADWKTKPPGTRPDRVKAEHKRRAARRERTRGLLAEMEIHLEKNRANRDFLGHVNRGETWKVDEMLVDTANRPLDLNYEGMGGLTALHMAGQPGLATTLLRHGADPQARTSAWSSSDPGFSQGGNTALHYAARGGSAEVVTALLEESQTDTLAMVGLRNEAGTSALGVARKAMQQRVAKLLEHPREAVAKAHREKAEAAAAAKRERERKEAAEQERERRREARRQAELDEAAWQAEEEALRCEEELLSVPGSLLTREEARKLEPAKHCPH